MGRQPGRCKRQNKTHQFLNLGMVMDKCRGGENIKRTSITGRLSWRGRESYKLQLKFWRQNKTRQFLNLGMVMDKCKGGEYIKRTSITGRLFLSFSYIQLSMDPEK